MLITLLRRHLGAYSGLLAGVVVAHLLGTGASLALPSLNARIIDDGVATGDLGLIGRLGAVMLGLSLLQVVFSLVAVWLGARVATSVAADIRQALYQRVVTFSHHEVTAFGAPSLITRTTNDITQIQTVVQMTLMMVIIAPLMMVGGVVMALREDVTLSAVMLVAVPALAVFVAILIRTVQPLFGRVQKRLDGLNTVVREQVSGVRVIRAFTRESHEQQRFAGANRDLTQLQLRIGFLMALMWPTVTLIMNLASVAAIGFGAGRIMSGQMQVGQLTAFIVYLSMILMSVMMASMMLMIAPRGEISARRIMEVMTTESSVAAPADPVFDLGAGARVRFDAATFQYPGADAPVLRDITFDCAPGTTTAIIGSTGAGKSTLVNLVPRLFDTTAGAVRINDIDVSDIDPETLWARIGLVPQRSYLFSGTVASNLRLGRPEASEEELWAALEVADAAGFVRDLADGLEASVAQGGTNFSGGQRQRLAIARAVVRRPDIYLFDDSFSALDVATDVRVRRALAGVTQEATVLLVAQRVSTVMGADRIVVLEDGDIVGMGDHDELVRTCATYREIVDSQLAVQ